MNPDTGEPPATDVQDSNLECPHCLYNLTGLSENRCPECGEPFDPDELARLSGPEAVPTTPWELRGGFAGFRGTWAQAAFRPTELARRFPRRHDTSVALSYSLCCYAGAAAAFIILGSLACIAIPDEKRWICGPLLGISVSAVFAAWVCEIVLAGVLALLVRPTHSPERFHFWRGLIRYTSGFLILTGTWGGMTACLVLAADSFDSEDFIVITITLAWIMVILAIVIFFWWCAVLWSIIWRRGRRDSPRLLACLAIPFIGVGAIVLGYLISVALILGCYHVLT